MVKKNQVPFPKIKIRSLKASVNKGLAILYEEM